MINCKQKNSKKQLILLVSLFFLFSFLGCDKNKSIKFTGNFEKDFDSLIPVLCKKNIECNANLFRTFPKELRIQNPESKCIQQLSLDFQNSKQYFDPIVQKLTLDCSVKIIETNCKKLYMEILSNPSCYQLRELTTKIRINLDQEQKDRPIRFQDKEK